jgi:galactose mutarotase-like enzyme
MSHHRPRDSDVSIEESGSLLTSRPIGEGLTEISIRGNFVTLVVVPEAGGKILQLIDNESGFNLLWQNPRVPIGRTYAGAPFDDVWCGGWDDIFPTDAACEFNGNAFHDHGDLWIGPWTWSVEKDGSDELIIRLSRDSVSLPCTLDKWITVTRDGHGVSVSLRLTNHGLSPVRFMWNQHIAHAIGPGSRVHLPVSKMGAVPPAPSLDDVREVTWPINDGADLSRLAGPEAGVLEFLYALDIRAGWFAVTHPSHGVAVKIEFDKEVFRTPWLWRVLGGWRSHYVLLTETCTSLPGSLASAIQNDSAATLAAGASLKTEMRIVVSREFDLHAPGDQDPLISTAL